MIHSLKKNAKNLTILCVDDEPHLLESIVTFCEKVFAKVLSATNGQEAFELYKYKKPDIIITDLMMPVLNGMDMIAQIRENDYNIPIIVLSAHTEIDLFLKSIDLGVDGYITKPMNFNNIIMTFDKICEKINLKKENELYKKELELKVEVEIQKRVQSEKMMLAQAKQAAMGEMIGMIAHQWRQPLSAITSTINTLEIKTQLNRYDKEFFLDSFEKIIKFTSTLSNTIDDFRNFFKTNKIKESITFETIINNALELMQASMKQNNIKIITKFNLNKSLNLYANEVQQVVLNLLKNAQDALKEVDSDNKIITIETYKKDNIYYLTVLDNAGGIKEDIINDIFNPYFTTKEEKDGTGLGLYMSKTIIQEHCNGKLSVENIENVGAKFTIAIPNE